MVGVANSRISKLTRCNRVHPTRLVRQELARIRLAEWYAIFGAAGISVLGVLVVRLATAQQLSQTPTPIAAAPSPTTVTPPVNAPAQAIAQPKAAQPAAKPPESRDSAQLLKKWTEGGEDSVLAQAIGAAEGTRTVDGGKTSLYEGHVDPGNGVWNRGTFSYQFGNEENLTAEESGRRQQAKIIAHVESTVLRQAKEMGITLTPWELINATDVANQAPLCITEPGGYIERLVEARKMAKDKGWNEYKIVLWARIEAFWDPSKGAYNAGGLRAYDDIGKRESIMRDQDRRMNMMLQVMERLGYAVDGGGSYQPVSFNPVAAQQFFDQVKGVLPTNRTPDGSRGGRVAPLEYTTRFNAAIGLVETRVER